MTVHVQLGDSLEVLRRLPADSISAVVTDPPYGLGKPPDMVEVLEAWLAGVPYVPKGRGFMGKEWDAFVPGPELWREVYRVLKPGAHAAVFAGTRTQDVMGLALRLAGFEIRDSVAWLYGSGYAAGTSNTLVDGVKWGTRLGPGHEPILLVRKPLKGQLLDGSAEGRIHIDATRIPVTPQEHAKLQANVERLRAKGGSMDMSWGNSSDLAGVEDASPLGRWPKNVALDEDAAAALDAQVGPRKGMTGGGRHKTAPDAIAGGGTDCPSRGLGGVAGPSAYFYIPKASRKEREAGLDAFPVTSLREAMGRDLEAAGARNPAAGAGRSGGRRNFHNTVKPVALMQWLLRLIVPPGGVCLDPFGGSGTTGIAAVREGFDALLIEREAPYVEIAKARIAHAMKGIE